MREPDAVALERAEPVPEHGLEAGPDRPIRYTESVRLYGRDELAGLLSGCGLETEASFGDFSGAPFTEDAPRCILVARRAR